MILSGPQRSASMDRIFSGNWAGDSPLQFHTSHADDASSAQAGADGGGDDDAQIIVRRAHQPVPVARPKSSRHSERRAVTPAEWFGKYRAVAELH